MTVQLPFFPLLLVPPISGISLKQVGREGPGGAGSVRTANHSGARGRTRPPRPGARSQRPARLGPRLPGDAARPLPAPHPLPRLARPRRAPGRRSATRAPPLRPGAARPPARRPGGDEAPLRRRHPARATHILSGTSRRPSTTMSGRKSSLKAEVMFSGARGGGGGGLCARPSGHGRRETGGDRCARPPGGRRSRRWSHSLPRALCQSPPPASAGAAGCGAPGAAGGGGAPGAAARRLTPAGPPGRPGARGLRAAARASSTRSCPAPGPARPASAAPRCSRPGTRSRTRTEGPGGGRAACFRAPRGYRPARCPKRPSRFRRSHSQINGQSDIEGLSTLLGEKTERSLHERAASGLKHGRAKGLK